MMHIIVTILVVLFSIVSLVLVGIGGRKEGLKRLSTLAFVCLATMTIGAIGTGAMPKAVFGLFERISSFSAVVFNAILGYYLFAEKFPGQKR